MKAPDGSIYKTVSSIEDVIEKQSPAMWFGSYAFFKATQLHGLPKDQAKELSFAVLKENGSTNLAQFFCSHCLIPIVRNSRRTCCGINR